MWKALSDNITYWKLSYILAWSDCFGSCNRKHMRSATVKRLAEQRCRFPSINKTNTHAGVLSSKTMRRGGTSLKGKNNFSICSQDFTTKKCFYIDNLISYSLLFIYLKYHKGHRSIIVLFYNLGCMIFILSVYLHTSSLLSVFSMHLHIT